ncbi:MAG: NAD-dependent malic enzyme [Candidatus Schekmanbacteria bacterium]|nr:NAD-dependent malic enzyme [Candidatus Schekmanbacteria bacterium]
MIDLYTPRRDPITNEEFVPVPLRGRRLIDEPLYNKGTVWTDDERDALQLRGLLPPHVSSEDEQRARAYGNFSRQLSDLDKYMFLASLHDRNETLYYRLLMEHLEEMMPIIYTPTVGAACKAFHRIYQRPRGLYIAAAYVEKTASIIRAATQGANIAIGVVSDGERILGLGDLGASGMGIPIGKLSLYVAAAGIHPANTLPILLDVGTNNQELLHDPLYLGTCRPRLRGEAYDNVVGAFAKGFVEACPNAILQFEDFGKDNAFVLLERYRDRIRCFNDDIQGTGAVALGAVLAALRLSGNQLAEQRILIAGAGGAGVGIARAFRTALGEEGTSPENIVLCDSRGLVLKGQERLQSFKAEFGADPERMAALGLSNPAAPLEEIVAAVRPTVLVGATGQAGYFTEGAIRAMAANTEAPIIMPLSNPTSLCEASPQSLAEWTEGRAIVGTGSPFPAVRWNGAERPVGQCNNVFIFPGVGLGIIISRARYASDSMFSAAARALADCVSWDRLVAGAILPPINDIRTVSLAVATAVAEQAVTEGYSAAPRDTNWRAIAEAAMWSPRYFPFRYAPEPSSLE